MTSRMGAAITTRTRCLPRPGPLTVGRALVGLWLAATFLAGVRGQPDAAGGLETVVLQVGLPRTSFSDLNENDAKATYRAFISASGRKMGYNVRSEITIYDTREDFEKAARAGKMHALLMSSWGWVTGNVRDVADIAYVPLVHGSTQRRFILLVRRDRGYTSFRDLRGRSLLWSTNESATLGRPWLDTLVMGDGALSSEAFFSKLTSVGKPGLAILPVFFGNADACLVDESSFAVAAELNPQLAKTLVALETSDPLVNGVVCVSRTAWVRDQHRLDFWGTLGRLHDDAAGRQVLTLFKAERLVPFEESQLTTLWALYRKHEALRLSLALQPAATDSP